MPKDSCFCWWWWSSKFRCSRLKAAMLPPADRKTKLQTGTASSWKQCTSYEDKCFQVRVIKLLLKQEIHDLSFLINPLVFHDLLLELLPCQHVHVSVKTEETWVFWTTVTNDEDYVWPFVGKQTKRLVCQDLGVLLSFYWGQKCKCCRWSACKWRPVSFWRAHGRRMVFISRSRQEIRTSSNYFFSKRLYLLASIIAVVTSINALDGLRNCHFQPPSSTHPPSPAHPSEAEEPPLFSVALKACHLSMPWGPPAPAQRCQLNLIDWVKEAHK